MIRINFKFIRNNNEYMVQWFKKKETGIVYFNLKEDALSFIKELKENDRKIK